MSKNDNRNNSKLATAMCILRRVLLSLVTLVLLVFIGLVLVCNLIFNGPSSTARDRLTMSMRESSGMKWCPALFIGKDTVAEIEKTVNAELPDDLSDNSQIKIDLNNNMGSSDEWANHPDGIRIERISGSTYSAYVMIIRDPSRVYLATSTENFSTSIPGTRINHQIETEGAVAAINAGAFLDDGTSGLHVGSVPQGLVISKGKVRWNQGKPPEEGFVGFNEDNILVVAKSMTADKAIELNIRDGCCFGPVLIMNGAVNEEAYNKNSGLNPRTAIGQRADGAVIFVCIDGRQASSLGGTYGDITDIMVEFGAVNACNLDGGSSTVMLHRDLTSGKVSMINNYSLLQEEPRRMPTFYMVRPMKEG
ncbi:MAG: phosphodiester glycosidase family protein [Oscillospiraceae bacterium]|nr:phosphodiester glycosidase family protein [Oscillospiraceae bacterium]